MGAQTKGKVPARAGTLRAPSRIGQEVLALEDLSVSHQSGWREADPRYVEVMLLAFHLLGEWGGREIERERERPAAPVPGPVVWVLTDQLNTSNRVH